MSPPELARGSARPAHWTVRTNYRLRTGAFLNMFVCIVLQGWGKGWSPVLWSAIGLHLLAYPHLVYWLARRSPKSQEAEVNNLTVDCLLFGILMGALQFPLWITFTVYIASTMNITISRGLQGLMRSQLASLAGASMAVALFGWNPSPDTGWPSIWLCVLGNAVYLSCVGIVAHSRNQQLRVTREALRAGELALNERFAEIQALQDKLQEQAIRDPLTGLFNRRFLESTVIQELARCRREGMPLVLVMIDVDHFKKVNDTYGHPAGDQVLKSLATRLQKAVRASDSACRYGGEEFILLLPGMDPATAWMRADRWRQEFSNDAIVFADLRMQATISIGIAAFPEDGDSLAELTRCADLALYEAKHTGRDRVVPYRDPSAHAAASPATPATDGPPPERSLSLSPDA
ncbi:MAG: diguanylate cyclase [Burkholderiaceae bacterium]|jgi:diguanylate cyclase